MPYADAARKRAWYLRNREQQLADAKIRHARKRDAVRQFIAEYLSDHPCVDCGERDPIVLDFDHVGTKSFNISRATTNLMTVEKVSEEIKQCEVRCANCHRRRTHRTLGHRTRCLAPSGFNPA